MILFIFLFLSAFDAASDRPVFIDARAILDDVAEKVQRRLPRVFGAANDSDLQRVNISVHPLSREEKSPEIPTLALNIAEGPNCLQQVSALQIIVAGVLNLVICHGAVVDHGGYNWGMLGKNEIFTPPDKRDMLGDLVLEARYSGRLKMYDALEVRSFITTTDLIDAAASILEFIIANTTQLNHSANAFDVESAASELAPLGCSIEKLQQERLCRVYLESFSHDMRAIYTR
jgi:hypothetical protein